MATAVVSMLMVQLVLVSAVRRKVNVDGEADNEVDVEAQDYCTKLKSRTSGHFGKPALKSECIKASWADLEEKYRPKNKILTRSMKCAWAKGLCMGAKAARWHNMCPEDAYDYDEEGKCRQDTNGNGILDKFAKTDCCEPNCPASKYGYDAEGKCRGDTSGSGILDKFAKKGCCYIAECPYSLYGYDVEGKCRVDSSGSGILDKFAKKTCCEQANPCQFSKYGYDAEGKCRVDSSGNGVLDLFAKKVCCANAGSAPSGRPSFGSHVECADGKTMCAGNQCCPRWSGSNELTYPCPSAEESWDMCETAPKPTPEPTDAPTPQPTEEPTAPPTEAPTAQPTEEPTPQPTDAPTAQPTEEPTPAPRVNRCPANVMDDNSEGTDECYDADEFEIFCHGKCADCCFDEFKPCPAGAVTIEDKENGPSCVIESTGAPACSGRGACGMCCSL